MWGLQAHVLGLARGTWALSRFEDRGGFQLPGEWPPRADRWAALEEATWQGRVVVKCSSLGFISKMLRRWQKHTCPQQARPTEGPPALDRLQGRLERWACSQGL